MMHLIYVLEHGVHIEPEPQAQVETLHQLLLPLILLAQSSIYMLIIAQPAGL